MAPASMSWDGDSFAHACAPTRARPCNHHAAKTKIKSPCFPCKGPFYMYLKYTLCLDGLTNSQDSVGIFSLKSLLADLFINHC